MALTERTICYETLIRWHEDGRIGAHQVDLYQILSDGTVVSSKPTEPQQLGTSDFEGVVPLADVLGEAASQALIQVEQLNQHADALEQQSQALAEQLQAALAQIDRLTAPQPVETAPEPEQA